MIKIVEIDCCDKCPHFDDVYYTYNEKCTLLRRVIKQVNVLFSIHPIPDDCPLEDKK